MFSIYPPFVLMFGRKTGLKLIMRKS